jgi:hypothetical protein
VTIYLHSFIAEEGLSDLLKQSCQSLHLHGIRVASTATPVNHLIFVDDSLMFVKASEEGAKQTIALLDKYCNASGQRENLDKSSNF